MKDRFSTQSDNYAKYRPSYPQELVEFIITRCKQTKVAWDAGTGSGQLVSKMAPYVKELYATDISYEQIKNAPQISNVTYHIQPAESTSFANDQFDLVTVAQALHWFDLDKFYEEANRVLKSNGVFAAIGYTLCRIEGVSEVLLDFYVNEIDSYWDEERKLVEDEYRSIPFPFEEDFHTRFEHHHEWSFNDFLGYLKTWSAVKKYELENGINPVDEWKEKFSASWGTDVQKDVVTPIFLRIGRKF